MIVVPILLMSYSFLGAKSLMLMLLFHGFSSPLLFSLVGHIYSIYSTRQLIIIRGLILCAPSLSLLMISGFIFSLCIPPFPSYVSEVIFFASSISMWWLAPYLLAAFSFMSLIYNLNWLSSSLFSSCSRSMAYPQSYLPYCRFFSIVIFVFVGMSFVFIFPFV
jgi:NADH:ubiquinone oxidoreductase subunit 4 (subunit M)